MKKTAQGILTAASILLSSFTAHALEVGQKAPLFHAESHLGQVELAGFCLKRMLSWHSITPISPRSEEESFKLFKPILINLKSSMPRSWASVATALIHTVILPDVTPSLFPLSATGTKKSDVPMAVAGQPIWSTGKG